MNNIRQYFNSRGDLLISLYINDLFLKGRVDHAKKILKTLERLEENNLDLLLRIKLVKKIKGRKNIFELIINWKKANYRIFFSIINGNFYLTNIFYKKKKKTPVDEIELAEKRKKELELNF
ncbi:MAG: type II toxin-antitoxin system RelE/ParE family toxin [Patescibacteria group bacterium]|jgi:phage-related protein